MKRRFTIFFLVVITFGLLTGLAQAEELTAETVVIESEELVELAGQEKFVDLIDLLERLVQFELAANQQEVTLEEIVVLDFDYLASQEIQISYYRQKSAVDAE